MEVDHIVPLAAGGAPYDPENLQTLCRPCHFDKTRRDRGARPVTRESLAWAALMAEIRSRPPE